MRRFVVAHGGTKSKKANRDGTDAAVEAGWKAIERASAVEAVVAAVAVLEDDERFNAGTGSSLRFDGQTIEMDAGVMDSAGRYGAVAGVDRLKNPVMVAHALMGLPNNVLMGEGAVAFARNLGHPDHDPRTPKARKSYRELIGKIKRGEAPRSDFEWDFATLERAWNYEVPFRKVFPDPHDAPLPGSKGTNALDTVGAVACDGTIFAAAASTGGTTTTLRGRIGDTPAIGAGLFASSLCAVAATGAGDFLLRARLATRLDDWLQQGRSPEAAVRAALELFPPWADTGMALAHRDGYIVAGNKDFAWSACEEGSLARPRTFVHRPRSGQHASQEERAGTTNRRANPHRARPARQQRRAEAATHTRGKA